MASLYPPYLDGTLPAFSLTNAERATLYEADKIYYTDDLVYVENSSGEKQYFISTLDNNLNEDVNTSVYWQAFTEGDGTITIPFEHNKAVAISEILNVVVKVKTIQNDTLIYDNLIGIYDAVNRTVQFPVKGYVVQTLYANEEGENVFQDSSWTVRIGQYYKIQVAYLSSTGAGYFSTVGVIKATSLPLVEIENLDKNTVNGVKNIFLGKFTQPKGGDTTEKVYSSEFIVKDIEGNIFAKKESTLHNIQNNPDEYTSVDSYSFDKELESGKTYTIQYIVTTTNGMKVSSPKYHIVEQLSLKTSLECELKAEINNEDGYVQIDLVDNTGLEMGNGAFVLTREDSLYPGQWDELYRFVLRYESVSRHLFKDFTIEQGKHYTYSIQQFNRNNIYSDRIKSNVVYADFDSIFIYDGKRQLKLKYNPQVTSFKTQLSETRSDTIGSKYPFFFRNARIGYKTFPVSGLISMLSDDNELFIPYEEILRKTEKHDRARSWYTPGVAHENIVENIINYHEGRNGIYAKEETKEEDFNSISTYSDKYKPTDLVAQNFTSERIFKMQVLDWMNNGEVKLFRSPAEGNFLVRFMDTSLAPQAQLGRMLHTINSTAYECAECNHSNLIKYGIIEQITFLTSELDFRVDSWKEINIRDYGYYTDNFMQGDNSGSYATNVKFIDFLPGTKIRLVFDITGSYEPESEDLYKDIQIGVTGYYYAHDLEPIYGIYLIDYMNSVYGSDVYGQIPYLSGTISYQYRTSIRNNFDLISNIKNKVGNYMQFMGKISYPDDYNDIRRSMANISKIKFYKRPIEYLYCDSIPTEAQNLFGDFDSTGYRTFNANFYWSYDIINDTSEKFSDQKSKQYSPFGIYILRDVKLNNIDLRDHLIAHSANTASESGGNLPTAIRANHLFERYYIDRLMKNLDSPETILLDRINLISKLNRCEEGTDERNKLQNQLDILNNEFPVVIFDAWSGDIIPLTNVDSYDPNIYINDKKISLFEIERYEIDNYDISSNKITVGNGVYGEVFFQSLEKEFTLESSVNDVGLAKDEWEKAYMDLYITSKKRGNDYSLYEIEKKRITNQQTYVTYINSLYNALKQWTARL